MRRIVIRLAMAMLGLACAGCASLTCWLTAGTYCP